MYISVIFWSFLVYDTISESFFGSYFLKFSLVELWLTIVIEYLCGIGAITTLSKISDILPLLLIVNHVGSY